jgi:hypothetical protein
VIVFDFALNDDNVGMLKGVFLHELGHVLGLRHEFAIEEEGQGAVLFGVKNKLSVMSYNLPPSIQQSDRDGVKAFYKESIGTLIRRKPITDFAPTPRTIV